MVDLYSRLHRYLYAFLLICVSTMSHSFTVTQKEIDMGGFPFNVVCSHATLLQYCTNQGDYNGACALWQVTLDSRYGFSFSGVQTASNGMRYCLWKGKNPANGTPFDTTQYLTEKVGLCPSEGHPPPEQVAFGRTGRWFPQELENKRCYRSCMYSNAQSFNYKHYVYTNGVMTHFTENTSDRLKSTAEFCTAVVEPARNSDGEITHDANCDDSFLTVFCNFVEWYRSDAEMPDAPPVSNDQLNLGYIDGSKVNIPVSTDGSQCLPKFERDFSFSIMNQTFTHKAEVDLYPICSTLWSLGNFFRIMYLLTACYIIFRD